MFTTIELSFLPIRIDPERLKIILIKTKIFIIPLFISIPGQQETYKYYGIWLVCVLVTSVHRSQIFEISVLKILGSLRPQFTIQIVYSSAK